MIKLCIVTTVLSTAKAFFGEQLRFLQDNGYDVTIIASPVKGREDIKEGIPKGVKIEYVPMSRTIDPWCDFKALISIFRIIRREQFDLVQYATPKGALLASVAARINNVPVRLYLMWGLYYVTQSGVKRVLFKQIEKVVCRCSTFIAPDSKGNCKLAVREGLCRKEKVAVVGHGSANGVDMDKYNPDRLACFRNVIRQKHGIPDEAFVFGTVAPVVGDKGINELVAAFLQVAKNNPNVYLLYVGQTAEKDPVKPETLRQLQKHERIIFLGRQAELEQYFVAMDVFVLPTYREGLGVVNIEASSMRLPVISTDVPGPQESVVDGKTGILVPAKEIDPLIKAMEEIMERPLMAKKLGEAGRERVRCCYEQKTLWQEILKHKKTLLLSTGKYAENANGEIVRV